MTDIRFFRKGPLAIAAMNVELPPFKNGEHNSESASAIIRYITALIVLDICWCNYFHYYYYHM